MMTPTNSAAPSAPLPTFRSGLEGVIAAETRLSKVEGNVGRLTIAGYAVQDLAPRASFEAVVQLLLHDRLPDAATEESFRAAIASQRALDPITLGLLRQAAAAQAAPIDALRLGLAALCAGGAPSPERLLGALPSVVAASARLQAGLEPLRSTRASAPPRTSSISCVANAPSPTPSERSRPTGTPSPITVSMPPRSRRA
jgi:citrate synthase